MRNATEAGHPRGFDAHLVAKWKAAECGAVIFMAITSREILPVTSDGVRLNSSDHSKPDPAAPMTDGH